MSCSILWDAYKNDPMVGFTLPLIMSTIQLNQIVEIVIITNKYDLMVIIKLPLFHSEISQMHELLACMFSIQNNSQI